MNIKIMQILKLVHFAVKYVVAQLYLLLSMKTNKSICYQLKVLMMAI
ncbi:MAG: hypothetical protein F082_1027 [bacterium F082]|nr:MAG: hypothetical protein F082_1027 [bacterium F082]KWW28682.1 MAG: hypothetical protein AUK64_1581 [bacterium P201]